MHGVEGAMKNSEPKNVVIIEDDPDTLEMFSEMMRLGGFRVFKSYGGPASIELLADVKPQVVILDVMLPDLSGIDLLHIIRKDPRIAHLPILLVSAKSQLVDIRRGLEAGANGYLTKPVTYRNLNNVVDSIIDKVGGPRVGP